MSSTSAEPRSRTARTATARTDDARTDDARTDDARTEARPSYGYGPLSPDEVVIGVALTTQWMLNTGRRLDQMPLMHDLTGDQLIDFWADDHLDPARSSKKPPCASRGASALRRDHAVVHACARVRR